MNVQSSQQAREGGTFTDAVLKKRGWMAQTIGAAAPERKQK